jgi:uncharacterized membrane protein YqgA involved in biofilm formation
MVELSVSETKEGCVPPDKDQVSPDNLTEQPINHATYLRRMRFIQRWRRIVLTVSLLLCIDAIVTMWLDPGLVQKPHVVLVQSLFAFMTALVIASNFLTVRLRK